MKFTYSTENDFAKLAAAQIAESGSSWDMIRYGEILTKAQDTRNLVSFLAERESSGSIQVMSDIWGQEWFREVLCFGGNAGLVWKRDGVRTTEDSTSDVSRGVYFHLPAPVTDSVWARIQTWLEETAGVVQGEVAGKQAADDVEVAARSLDKGSVILVVKGRKIPVGTTGTAFWVGPHKFKRYGKTVGFSVSGNAEAKRHDDAQWIDADNVETVVYEKALEAAKALAYQTAYDKARASVRTKWENDLTKYGVANPVAARALTK